MHFRSFDEIMAQTLMLIDGQKDGLKAKNLLENLKAILLVGGFGGSKYLHARISQEYPKSETTVKVWRGDHSWTAVVQGAVQCEVANRDIYAPFNTRLSRYHYGKAFSASSSITSDGQSAKLLAKGPLFGRLLTLT